MATSCTTSQCGTGSWGGPLPGDPDNSSLLSATSEFGGIRITWTLPNVNAYAVAYTKLYRSIGDDFATAIPYKFVAGNEYFDAQAADPIRGYYYWIQHVSVNGTELDPIGPVTSTAKPLLLKVLEDLQGQVEFTSLASDLRAKIDLITDLQNGLTQLNTSVTTENGLINQQLTALQNDLDDTLAYISQREVIEASERQAFVQAVNTQLAAVGDNSEIYAAIEEEATTRATQTGELFAQKVLKVDLAGNISGYGLAASVDPDGNATSEFQVRADTFSIAPPALVSNTAPANPYNGMVWEDTSTSPTTVRWYNSTTAAWQTTPVKAAVPFIVKTVPEVINGYTLEPGVYINAAYIGRLTANQIDTTGMEIEEGVMGGISIYPDRIQAGSFVSGSQGFVFRANGSFEINGTGWIKESDIGDLSVSRGKIKEAAIGTLQIADESVFLSVYSFVPRQDVYDPTCRTADYEVQIASATIGGLPGPGTGIVLFNTRKASTDQRTLTLCDSPGSSNKASEDTDEIISYALSTFGPAKFFYLDVRVNGVTRYTLASPYNGQTVVNIARFNRFGCSVPLVAGTNNVTVHLRMSQSNYAQRMQILYFVPPSDMIVFSGKR